jgi:phage I-like protein
LFYRRLLKHLDDAEANPAAERKEAANTEDLAEAMLHALTVTNGTEEDDQEEKEETVRDLEAIIGEAKDIGGMAAEQKRAENEALFVTLMDLSGAATYDEVANACKHARHSSNP